MNPNSSPAEPGKEQSGIKHSEIAVVIPARMAASRLPGKPLAVIGDAPMVVQVARRAKEAGFGNANGTRLVVACDDKSIADAVSEHGFEALMTSPDHPSGSDRVHESLDSIDPDGRIRVAINLQGDLPEVDASMLWPLADVVANGGADVATPVARITPEEMELDHVVKAFVDFPVDLGNNPVAGAIGRASTFSRLPDAGGRVRVEGSTRIFHHVGIYAWQRQALTRFVGLPPSPLERAERLEQMRALEDGMEIAAVVVDSAPGGIDTPADLEAVRKRFDKAKPEKG